MAKTYEISFKLGAQMAGNFAKTMSSAGSALGQLNKNISELGRQQNGINSVTKLRNEVALSSRAYIQAKQRVADLGRQMSATSEPSKELTRDFEKAKNEVSRTKERLTQKRSELKKLETQLGTTGKSTKDLIKDQQQMAAAADKARAAQASLQKTLGQMEANQSRRDELRGQMLDAAALAAAFAAPIKMAADFEQQMANVGAKGNATKEELAQLTKTARQLGATTSFSASQAGQGMEYLAMAGFKTTQIIEAMPGMLNLAAAANTDLGRTADIASDILSGFGLQAADMSRVADVLAKTTTTSNTNLEMLGDTMKYVGPVAKAAGMSLEEASAMAGLLANVGIKSSQAGTTLRSMLLRLSAPAGKASEVLKQLGVETRDVNGDARNMVEILGDVARATEDMGSAERLEALKNIFGEEPAAGMAELIAQGGADGIAKYLEVIESSSGTAAKIAADINATVKGQFRQLASATESLAISIGNILLPVVGAVTKIMTKTAQVLDSFTQQFPTLSKVLVIGVAGLMALKVAAIAFGYAFTFVKGAVLSVTAALKLARVAWLLNSGAIVANTTTSKAAIVMSKALAAAQWLVNAAMTANPIGLVIAAIVALIAIGVTLYKNWDSIAKFFTGAWSRMRSAAISAWQSISNYVIAGLNRLKQIFQSFNPLSWMRSGFNSLSNFANNFSLYNSGKAILRTLGNGIKAAASYPVNAVKNVFAKVRKYLPFSDAKMGPLSELTASGSAIMNTLGDGMRQAGPQSLTDPLQSNASNMVSSAGSMSDRAGRVNASAGGGGITVQITQHIALGNAGAEVEAQARSGAAAGAADMIRQMRDALARERRLSYA